MTDVPHTTLSSNLRVKEVLDFLASRLDPIIAKQLAQHLHGQPWTVILEILDEKRGYSRGHKYETYDLQAQLRILTERLGDFGFPFDDHQRTVSTIGSDLRIIRNHTAHNQNLTRFDALRAAEQVVRLLEHFQDVEGLKTAHTLRLAALTELANDQGITAVEAEKSAATRVQQPLSPAQTEPAIDPDAEPEPVTPAEEMLERTPTVIGQHGLRFEPWTVVPVAGTDVLDDMPKKYAKEQVRAVAHEIATYEWPIHLDRLVEKTAQSFNAQRLRADRKKKLAYQIRQIGFHIDADKFAWPPDIDPSAWQEFRPNDSDADRTFEHISPRELANAAQFIKTRRPGLTQDELENRVLQTFGRKRRSKSLNRHLKKAQLSD